MLLSSATSSEEWDAIAKVYANCGPNAETPAPARRIKSPGGIRMRNAWLLGICLIAVAALPGSAFAQDTPKAGLVIGYPASLGVIWHAGKKVAIRPEFAITGSSSKSEGTSFNSHSSGVATTFGLSVLFYAHTDEHLRTYFVPRFLYGHASSKNKTSSSTNPSVTSDNDLIGGSGAFGASYQLARKFAMFGELGFGVEHVESTSSVNTAKNRSTTWGTRAGVGVIFYP
jgi:hypothetical protein